MSAKRGLGRGLDALLGAEPPRGDSITLVAVDAIRPNPRQPRTNFDSETLSELERSIRQLGVLVPLIVRALPNAPGTFELVAGERRWRAATAAGLTQVPALVRDVDDRSSLEVALVENLQRQDLDPLEEAMGLQHMLDEFDFTQERLAERVGRSRPAITNALRLLTLSDDLKSRLRRGALTVGHARALLSVDPSLRDVLAKRIEREHLSVRDVERLGERRVPRKQRPAQKGNPPDLIAVESKLRYKLGAPVAIVAGPAGAGRIEIRFADNADLTRIVDVLLPEGS